VSVHERDIGRLEGEEEELEPLRQYESVPGVLVVVCTLWIALTVDF